ncbi:MAG TPA: flagellar hook-length control protein FliK [Rugosimonospora sp.]|nr:flagellar hook-length control protein FliK [Rugosimonospora sp.]
MPGGDLAQFKGQGLLSSSQTIGGAGLSTTSTVDTVAVPSMGLQATDAGLLAAASAVGAGTPITAATPLSAPTAAPAPAAPATQLAARILPLRHEPDGIHQLTVHMHPADLGPVSLVAEVRNGAVRLQLTGGTEVAHHALREALPELRQQLSQAGLECSVDLRQRNQDAGTAQQWAAPGRQGFGSDAEPELARPVAAEPPTTPARNRAGQLDLHV